MSARALLGLFAMTSLLGCSGSTSTVDGGHYRRDAAPSTLDSGSTTHIDADTPGSYVGAVFSGSTTILDAAWYGYVSESDGSFRIEVHMMAGTDQDECPADPTQELVIQTLAFDTTLQEPGSDVVARLEDSERTIVPTGVATAESGRIQLGILDLDNGVVTGFAMLSFPTPGTVTGSFIAQHCAAFDRSAE